MEFGLKNFFAGWLVGGWLVDGIFFGGRGSVWVSKYLVLISPNNCLCPSSHQLQSTLRKKARTLKSRISHLIPDGRPPPPGTGKGVRSEGLLVEQVPPCNGISPAD